MDNGKNGHSLDLVLQHGKLPKNQQDSLNCLIAHYRETERVGIDFPAKLIHENTGIANPVQPIGALANKGWIRTGFSREYLQLSEATVQLAALLENDIGLIETARKSGQDLSPVQRAGAVVLIDVHNLLNSADGIKLRYIIEAIEYALKAYVRNEIYIKIAFINENLMNGSIPRELLEAGYQVVLSKKLSGRHGTGDYVDMMITEVGTLYARSEIGSVVLFSADGDFIRLIHQVNEHKKMSYVFSIGDMHHTLKSIARYARRISPNGVRDEVNSILQYVESYCRNQLRTEYLVGMIELILKCLYQDGHKVNCYPFSDLQILLQGDSIRGGYKFTKYEAGKILSALLQNPVGGNYVLLNAFSDDVAGRKTERSQRIVHVNYEHPIFNFMRVPANCPQMTHSAELILA
jgi:uncharacterized LabA/DUF88 family protein